MMHILTVKNDHDDVASIWCDCGHLQGSATTDIEILAICFNHIRTSNLSKEGAISFPSKYVVVTPSNITVLEK